MTFPIDIHVGGWTVSSHFLFKTLAYVIGFRLYLIRWRRRGDHISDSHRWSVLAAAAIGAVVGSRLLFWLEDPSAIVEPLRAQVVPVSTRGFRLQAEGSQGRPLPSA